MKRTWQPAWGLVTLAVTVGVAAVVVRYRWADVVRWAPDLAVGWGLAAFGLVARVRRPGSWSSLLLYVAGLAWFIGNAAVLPFAPLAAIAAQLALLHRAALAHAILTTPRGRPGSVPAAIAIGLGYVLWVAFPAAPLPVVLIASLAAVAATTIDVGRAPRPSRRPRAVALVATVVLAAAYTVVAVVHEAVPSGTLNIAALLLDEAALLVAGALLLYAIVLPKLGSDRLTDLVVELRGRPSDGLRDALATALGDPSLELGYWDAASGTFRDTRGMPVSTAVDPARRAVTSVEVDGTRAAVLVHDPAIGEAAPLREALEVLTGLAAANGRLREQLLDRLVDVRASRRRLLLAGDAERAALERRLDDGPVRRATLLAAELDGLPRQARTFGEHVERAQAVLSRAIEDLRELGRGLHPRSLDDSGLDGALRSISDASPVPVSFDVHVSALPDAIALAAYFVCAEGVANAVKHANATRIAVRVQQIDSAVSVAVDDDGAGGADAALGRGLRGIEDRVEALGGLLSLQSAPGAGTILRARLPLGEPPSAA